MSSAGAVNAGMAWMTRKSATPNSTARMRHPAAKAAPEKTLSPARPAPWELVREVTVIPGPSGVGGVELRILTAAVLFTRLFPAQPSGWTGNRSVQFKPYDLTLMDSMALVALVLRAADSGADLADSAAACWPSSETTYFSKALTRS